MTETEVAAVHGTATVESVSLRDRATAASSRCRRTAVFVMIGADPCTEAAHGHARASTPPATCSAAPARRSCDGHLSWPLADREPHLLETVRPGVFAAGDVRAGASNRVAGAVGDGALVVRFAHDVLDG